MTADGVGKEVGKRATVLHSGEDPQQRSPCLGQLLWSSARWSPSLPHDSDGPVLLLRDSYCIGRTFTHL